MTSRGIGYLYFVKLEEYNNCYKIGCTCDVTTRLKNLEYKYGKILLLASGLVSDKLKHERELKRLLYPFCNQKVVSDRICNHLPLNDPTEFPGGVVNYEHLVLPDGTSKYKALQVFKNYIDLYGVL